MFERATFLQHECENDLSAAFPVQMVCSRDSMQGEMAKVKSVKELAHLLIIENASVSSSFADVTAPFLFLTILVTGATAERSFSKLEIIKSYLRNSMGETRLYEGFHYWRLRLHERSPWT